MNRVDEIRTILEKRGLDGIILSDIYEVSWATGFTGDDSHCVVTKDDAVFFTDFRYTEQAENQVRDFEIAETGGDDRVERMSKLAKGRVGIDFTRTSVAELKRYENELDADAFEDISADIAALRMIKSEDEISRMREGARITEEAFYHIAGYIKEGMTENDINAEMIFFFNKRGAEPSFKPIIASGENGSMPHAVVSDRRVRRGDFITMDFGVRYKGVCTDFTRTIALGGIEKDELMVYNTVKSAQQAALCALKPGVTGKQADEAARSVIYNAGYKGYFGHGTGHGVGLEIHEAPRLSTASRDVLAPGMVVTAEPGIYLPGRFGVRIEDMLLITKDGYENFYTADKDIIII